MENINSIQFDGRFNTEVMQGTYKLFTEVKFTAILNIEIADPDKFNTMFGGQLPVDLIKNDASPTKFHLYEVCQAPTPRL